MRGFFDKKFLYLFFNSGGGGGTDLGPIMTQAINQANLPKSSLSGGVSNLAQQAAPSVFANLMNAQSMGNSFFGNPAQTPFAFQQPQWIGQTAINNAQSNIPLQQTAENAWNGVFDQENLIPNNAGQASYNMIGGGGNVNPIATPQAPGAGGMTAQISGVYNPYANPSGEFAEANFNFNPALSGIRNQQQAQVDAFNNTNWMSQMGKQPGLQPGFDYGNSPEQILAAFNRELVNAGQSPLASGGIPSQLSASMMATTGGMNPRMAEGNPTQGVGPVGYNPTPARPGTGTSPGANNTVLPFPTNPSGGWAIPQDLNNVGQPVDGTPWQYGVGNFPGGFNGGGLSPVATPGFNGPTGPGWIPQLMQANPQLGALSLQQQNPFAMNTLSQQINAPQAQNFNPSQQLIDSGAFTSGPLGIGGLSNAIMQTLAKGSIPINNQNVNAPNIQGGAADISQGLNSPYMQGLTQTLQNQFNQGRADLRARFGANNASRSSGASLAEAQFNAQNLPVMAQALGDARSREVGNLLQNQALANNFSLGLGSQGLQAGLANASNNLQAQALNAQGQGNQLSSLLNAYGQQGNLLGNLAGQAGNQNLGLQSLGSQNFLSSQGLMGQNASNLLNAQNNYLNTILGAQGQNNNLLAQLAQFNAGQGNQFNLGLQNQMQTAMENQLNRGFTGQQNLLSSILGLAGAGIPGGSANVNISPMQPQQSNLMQNLGGLASIAAMFL